MWTEDVFFESHHNRLSPYRTLWNVTMETLALETCDGIDKEQRRTGKRGIIRIQMGAEEGAGQGKGA